MRITFLIVSFLLFLTSIAQQRIPSYEAYIETYRDIAIAEMAQTGIPASIKLAQAILESGAGTSKLAREANNHFGIKCHSGWEGKKVYHDDDAKGECFRHYKKAIESFKDHSEFLRTRQRYAALFELSPTDYKAWAHGLKKAGYATNPKYPERLITLIETYELHQYDKDNAAKPLSKSQNNPDEILETRLILMHPNSLKYIKAEPGDTYESLAEELRIPLSKLLQYNELTWEALLKPGDIVYLQSKRKKGAEDFYYVSQQGATMFEIAHQTGMKLEALYTKNKMKVGEQPKPGQQIWLRKKKP
jgi:LysM repeat protein